MDKEEIAAGSPSWEANIENAIPESSAIVVLLSPDAKKSPWVRSEITLANQHNIQVYPILIKGNEKNAIFLRLISSQYIDFRDEKETIGLSILSQALSSYLIRLEN